MFRPPLCFIVFDHWAKVMKICHQGVDLALHKQNVGSQGQRVNNSCDGVELYYLWPSHVGLVMKPMTEPVVYLREVNRGFSSNLICDPYSFNPVALANCAGGESAFKLRVLRLERVRDVRIYKGASERPALNLSAIQKCVALLCEG